jgi:hypothetical protein
MKFPGFFFKGDVSGFGSGSTDTSEISPENYRSFKKNLGLCTKRKKVRSVGSRRHPEFLSW